MKKNFLIAFILFFISPVSTEAGAQISASRTPPTTVPVNPAPAQTATVPSARPRVVKGDSAPPAPSNNQSQNITVRDSTSVPSKPSKQSAQLALYTAKDYFKLGIKHGRAKRFDEAVEAFKQAISLNPNYADAHFSLGYTYAKMGRWKESVEAYEQVVRLDPKDAEAFEMLGKSYAQLRAQTETTLPNNSGAVAVNEKAGTATAPIKSLTDSRTPATGTSAVADPTGATGNIATGMRTAATENVAGVKPITTSAANSEDLTVIYRVGVGDVLDVRLPDLPGSRSTLYTVTAGGLLELPLLSEPIRVTGLTTDEIEARIATELKRRAVDPNPKVSVGVREYVSHVVIVSGLVNDPGSKVLQREGVPLYVVVADAQPRPEAGRALVVSHVTGRRTTVDLSDQEAMKILVRPGDVVTVQARPREFFFIAGEVRERGQKEFHRGLTLTQAVMAAGGVTRSGSDVVQLTRQGADGRLVISRYNLSDIKAGKVPDPPIQPGDRIEVAP